MTRILLSAVIAVAVFGLGTVGPANTAHAQSAACYVPGNNTAATGRQNVLRVPSEYPTISAAIAAASPGDMVKVANGVYTEQVIIDKPIRVQGSDPKHTIIDGENKTALSDVGQVRVVAAGNVEFSGFTIVNAGRSASGTRAAIYTESPVAGVTYEIHHTQSIGSNDPAQTFPTNPDFGFWSVGGKEHLFFHHNEISLTTASAFLLQRHVGPTTINDNSFDIGYEGAAVWIASSDGVHITTPQRVCRNSINSGRPDVSGFPGGVTFNAGWPTGIAGGFTDVQIAHNAIWDVAQNRRGIGLVNFATDPTANNIRATIEHNRVLGSGGYEGITLFGYTDGVKIRHNQINGITGEPSIFIPGQGETFVLGFNGGIRLRDLNGIAPVNAEISDNNIEAVRGISVEADASWNWISRNRVWAVDYPIALSPSLGVPLTPVAVELGADTYSNSVTDNLLRTPAEKGDAAVLDNSGGVNTVAGNR